MNNESKSDNLLDRVCIAMPCSMDWDQMKGNDQVRLCGGCNKNVFNISAMSKKEAEAVLKSPQAHCLQIARHEDGSLVTDEQPRLLRTLRSFAKKSASAALSLLAILLPQAASASDPLDKRPLLGRPIQPNKADTSAGGKQTKKTCTLTPLSKLVNFKAPHSFLLGKRCAVENLTKGSKVWRSQVISEKWPNSLTEIGFSKEDILPLDPYDSDCLSQLEKVAPASATIDSVDQDPKVSTLYKEAWLLAEQARAEHMRACIYLLRKEYKECVNACITSAGLYDKSLQSLNNAPSKDPKLAEFLKMENAKVLDLKTQASSAITATPEKEISK